MRLVSINIARPINERLNIVLIAIVKIVHHVMSKLLRYVSWLSWVAMRIRNLWRCGTPKRKKKMSNMAHGPLVIKSKLNETCHIIVALSMQGKFFWFGICRSNCVIWIIIIIITILIIYYHQPLWWDTLNKFCKFVVCFGFYNIKQMTDLFIIMFLYTVMCNVTSCKEIYVMKFYDLNLTS